MSAQNVNMQHDSAGYDDAVKDALRQCLLLPDYHQAAALWMQMTRILRKAGCPQELIQKYEDQLVAYFEQKQHMDDPQYGQVVNAGGGVINIFHGQQEQKPKKPITTEQIVAGIGQCGQYMWGYSSLAVIYSVCTQCYSLPENMSHFEKEMNRYDVKCPAGTIDSTIRKNAYLRYPIDQWEEKGAKERVMKLVGAFRQAVDGK